MHLGKIPYSEKIFFKKLETRRSLTSLWTKWISHSSSSIMLLGWQTPWPPRLIGCKSRTSAFHILGQMLTGFLHFSQMFAFQHLESQGFFSCQFGNPKFFILNWDERKIQSDFHGLKELMDGNWKSEGKCLQRSRHLSLKPSPSPLSSPTSASCVREHSPILDADSAVWITVGSHVAPCLASYFSPCSSSVTLEWCPLPCWVVLWLIEASRKCSLSRGFPFPLPSPSGISPSFFLAIFCFQAPEALTGSPGLPTVEKLGGNVPETQQCALCLPPLGLCSSQTRGKQRWGGGSCPGMPQFISPAKALPVDAFVSWI